MNILVIGNGSLSVAGQEHKVAIEFAKKGHKTYLLKNPASALFDAGPLETHPLLNVMEIPFNEYKFDYLNIEDKIDVCLGMDQSVCPFVAEYKNRTKVKSFCMFLDFPIHVIDDANSLDYNFQYSQRYYYWINCALELDNIIFNNGVAVDEFAKRYKRQAHLVFYPITPQVEYEDLKELPKTNDYVAGCNRLIHYKGTEYTLKALKRLEYEYRHIYVSGDKNHTEILNALCKELPKPPLFTCRLSEKEKMVVLYNARLVVYPQITEWIGGLSIIEGWAVKTPGICFDYPVLRELYGDCAVYVKPKSVLALREAIQALYEDEEKCKELGEKGYQRYQQLFTKSIAADNFLKIFND